MINSLFISQSFSSVNYNPPLISLRECLFSHSFSREMLFVNDHFPRNKCSFFHSTRCGRAPEPAACRPTGRARPAMMTLAGQQRPVRVMSNNNNHEKSEKCLNLKSSLFWHSLQNLSKTNGKTWFFALRKTWKRADQVKVFRGPPKMFDFKFVLFFTFPEK